jgi:hypothetical protein
MINKVVGYTYKLLHSKLMMERQQAAAQGL